MMSKRMIQRSRPFAIAVPKPVSTGVGRRCAAGFDTNFCKELPAKAAKEGEGAAASAPPPPPDSGPGGGDRCRKPECRTKWGGPGRRPARRRKPQPRGVPGERGLEQHELAVARGEKVEHLRIAVARLQSFAH